jgi:hypothetical protein
MPFRSKRETQNPNYLTTTGHVPSFTDSFGSILDGENIPMTMMMSVPNPVNVKKMPTTWTFTNPVIRLLPQPEPELGMAGGRGRDIREGDEGEGREIGGRLDVSSESRELKKCRPRGHPLLPQPEPELGMPEEIVESGVGTRGGKGRERKGENGGGEA